MAQTKQAKKELHSEFSYNRLWKLLIDRNIKKKDLQEMSDVSAHPSRRWDAAKTSRPTSC